MKSVFTIELLTLSQQYKAADMNWDWPTLFMNLSILGSESSAPEELTDESDESSSHASEEGEEEESDDKNFT